MIPSDTDSQASTSRHSTIRPKPRSRDAENTFLLPPAMRSRQSYSALATKDLSNSNAWGLIHRIRRDIKKCIETALSWEQLNSPKLVFSVVRPLQDAYMKLNSPCTIYALLLNRVHFLSQQYTLSSLSVNNTRAMVCELLAIKILRQLYDDDTSEDGVFRLCVILATTFSPFQGAPKWAIPESVQEFEGVGIAVGDRKMSTSALEMAIVSESKRFIRAVPTQRVIMSIYTGKIVYSGSSFRYLIKDQYKRRPIMKYDVKRAPFLDHYRLRVPRIRAALEWSHFAVLFFSYLLVLRTMQHHTMNGYEIFWVLYGFGFALDKFASLLELGWTVFAQNLWNGLDFVFIIMFLIYLPLRLIGLRIDHESASVEALSILTCAGCVLFPRFAFVTLSDNLLILSLRSMMAQFIRLMVLAVWCFAGFFVAFLVLGSGKYKASEIIQWMVWIWFGLDATGMQRSTHLHNVLGPVLMIIYACLSSTLLLTVLVSILSNTFNAINQDAIAEQMYRRAVSTFQGVKSDGIFSFQPPINIAAFLILWPARFFMDAHHYHQLIVFFARASNLPLLLAIRAVERYFLFADSEERTWVSILKSKFDIFRSAHLDLDAVFEYEEDIDDDALPGGAFQIYDGTRTPDHDESPAKSYESRDSTIRESDRAAERKRRTMSMSDWGQSTLRHKPTLLSKLYGPGKHLRERDSVSFLDEGQEDVRERLSQIEDGQRRIEEALKAMGGGE